MSVLKAATLSILFALPVIAHAEGGSDRVQEWHAQFQQAQKDQARQQTVADKKVESKSGKQDS